ncbi:MAG: penicillin-binding protein [Oscillospiraceae bacterium]|nr:penicillin-binding protein [Oscillospiraceae bacterium]
MEQKITNRRSVVLVLLLCAFLLCFCYVLYQQQVVHGEEALERSSRKITNSEIVPASRGEITDRNGIPLVSNIVTYDVTLSLARMGDEQEQNAQILSLIRLCNEYGLTYDDGFPLSLEAPFSDRRETLSAAQTARFQQYQEALSLPSPAEPQALLSALKQEYHIADSYSSSEARRIIGVRYELALRAKEISQTEYVFASNVPSAFIATAKEHWYYGAVITPVNTRQYQTTYAAHLLGRIAPIDSTLWPSYQAQGYPMNALVGRDGVEQAFEPYLRGVSGVRLTDTNTAGKVVNETYSVLPQPGKNISLTLDIKLQETTENALAAFLKAKKSPGGAAVVMDVKTGGVLAMASYPTFDLAQYSAQYETLSQDPNKPLFNRATQGTYAPGSTFKMVTAAGALEEGIITPSSRIRDTGRYTFYPDYQPMCWLYRQYGSTHGSINLSKALEVSCNVFFYDIGRRLTIEKLDDYAQRFGLGQKTGIELSESTGILAGPAYSASLGQDWVPGSTLAAAIGQSYHSFTPLQLCNYVATLANGGTRHQAHLLQTVTSYDNTQVEYQYAPIIEDSLDLSPATMKAIKKGMLAVTRNGTAARYFSGFDIAVCAKTGSAQVATSQQSNAVFVCFAPYDDPQVAIALVAEKGGSGYELGATARRILDAYFHPSKE